MLFSTDSRAQQIDRVVDMGLRTNLQDSFGGHFKRGRALVAADFDLDGRIDFYTGNPGDESYILRNVGTATRPNFQPYQLLLSGALAWGAAASDYDNDGDYDLFITTGANEGVGLDHLFRNMLVEEGRLRFEDVTAEAGVAGPVPPGQTQPIEIPSANAVWGDYDRDGDNDLFVSVNIWLGGAMDDGPDTPRAPATHEGHAGHDAHPGHSITSDAHESAGCEPPPPPALPAGLETRSGPAVPQEDDLQGRNILWRNNGDRTFTDVTDEAGLGTTRRPTRHSTFFDFDNDGDLDLYENNNGALNVLWRNRLMETGTATFEDATAAMSLPGEDLGYPNYSFASCAADFNNDGWEDLVGFQNSALGDQENPYGDGHVIFMNRGGAGFENVAAAAELNNPFISQRGVMGCQIGDLNADGTPDVYIGNGGPPEGQYDQLYLSDNRLGDDPHFVNRSALVDYPAPEKAGLQYPPYPYRTHGTDFIDVDGDGTLEIAVSNGGTASGPDEVQEPNRLFKFIFTAPVKYFRVRPVGDGVHVSRDAVGTRLALKVRRAEGTAQSTFYRTLYAGSCFSAQNGFDVHFLLGAAESISELTITWPDGKVQKVQGGLSLNSSVVVNYDGSLQVLGQTAPELQAQLAAEALAGDEVSFEAAATAAARPEGYKLEPNYPNPFNPETTIRYHVPEAAHVRLAVYDVLGREVQVLVDGPAAPGAHEVTFDAADLPSGLYLYRMEAGAFRAAGRMFLAK